jgi:hypothetical protein
MTAQQGTAVRAARSATATPPGADRIRADAAAALSPAEYVAAMRHLKEWTGLSYRQLETRAARAGEVLPRSTLTTALHRDRLPRPDLVRAFVRACGCDEEQTREWLAIRLRLAASALPGPAGTDRPGAPHADRSLAAQLMPPLWYRASRATRTSIQLVAAVAVLLAVAAALWSAAG